MRPWVTEKAFYQYLKCPGWIAHAVRSGEFAVTWSLRDRLQQDRLAEDIEQALIAVHRPNAVEIRVGEMEDRTAETLAAMQRGDQVIVNPVLIYDRFVASPSFLERIPGKSVFGDYFYIACDVRRSRRLKEEYFLQAAFYAEVLRFVQGTEPPQGYVMHRDGSISSFMLSETAIKYRCTLDSIERIVDGNEEIHFLTSNCKQSPWFAECKREALETDDLSRFNRLWQAEADELRAAGFITVKDVALAHPDLLASKVHGIPSERLHYILMQARALLDNRVITLGEVDLPDSPVRLVIDIESDPLRSVHYLFGVLVVDGDDQQYHAFLAKRPEDEGAAWRGFIEFIRGYVGVPILHYGTYEVDVLWEMGKKYEDDTAVLAAIEEQMVDVLIRMREKVVFPLSFYSLKDIAVYLGFHWRHKDASGLESVLWFEDWLAKGKTEVLQDILDYNEDDVRATEHVVRWAKGL